MSEREGREGFGLHHPGCGLRALTGFALHAERERLLREAGRHPAGSVNYHRVMNGYEPIEGSEEQLISGVELRVVGPPRVTTSGEGISGPVYRRVRGEMLLPMMMALAGVESLDELEVPPWWKEGKDGEGNR